MPETLEPEPVTDDTPALLEHCMVVYDAMMRESEEYLEHDYSDNLADGTEPPRLYKGMLTQLFVKLDYGISNYSRITNMMREMGSIEQIRRGAGKTPGMWLLWRRPDSRLFEWVKTHQQEKNEKEDYGHSVEQRLRDLQSMSLDLRETVELNEERLVVVEDRLDQLQSLIEGIANEVRNVTEQPT